MTNPLIRQLPNTLTVSRLVVALLFPWLPLQWQMPALVYALLTEFFDGFLSRALRVTSTFGRLADPVADKVFVLSVCMTLLAQDVIGFWQLFFVLSRDITVMVGVVWVFFRMQYGRYRQMPPRPSGKIATTLQFAFLISLVWSREVWPWLFYLTVIGSAASAVDYIRWFALPPRPESKTVSG